MLNLSSFPWFCKSHWTVADQWYMHSIYFLYTTKHIYYTQYVHYMHIHVKKIGFSIILQRIKVLFILVISRHFKSLATLNFRFPIYKEG